MYVRETHSRRCMRECRHKQDGQMCFADEGCGIFHAKNVYTCPPQRSHLILHNAKKPPNKQVVYRTLRRYTYICRDACPTARSHTHIHRGVYTDGLSFTCASARGILFCNRLRRVYIGGRFLSRHTLHTTTPHAYHTIPTLQVGNVGRGRVTRSYRYMLTPRTADR